MPRQNQIQFRKGTYSQWDAQSSTVLGSGEPGFITDFNKLKIGDGSTQWSDLAAINDALTTLVYNGTASTIPKMSVVYINGAQGDMPSIRLSIASGEMTSSKTYGITTNAISAGGTGMVVVDGALKNLNTSPTFDGVTPGTTLWLSPTVSGGITTTKPSAPNHMVSVGNLVRVNNQQGIINVKIQNGFELEELHNVAVSGVSGGQFLYYNSSSGLWQPNPNIYSSGNSIGIRTSSPYGTFDVYGNIFVGENINGKLMIGDDSYGGELGILTNVDEALAIKYNDGSFRYGESLPGASDSIVVASDKNIGIGTSTPFSKLHIAGDTSCDGALKITYADTNIGDNNGTDLTPWKTIINDGTINTYNNGGFGFSGQGYNITLNGNGGDTGGASLSVNGSINCSSGNFTNSVNIGDSSTYGSLIVSYSDVGNLVRFARISNNPRIDLNGTVTVGVPAGGADNVVIAANAYNGNRGAITAGVWRGDAIEIDKGGTGRTSYSNGQLLIGSGTSLAANTLTATSGIGITNGSGTITIGVTGIPSSTITNFNSSVSGLLPTGTANYITKFGTGGSGLSNSIIYESGNNIGIGVTTPDAKLVVSGSLYTTDKLGVGGACRSTLSADLGGAVGLAWSEGTFIGMQFQNTDAYRMGIVGVAGSRQTRILAKAADNAGIITFYPGAGTSEAGRFHSDGRFGIGTTSPASQLQVAGLLQGNSVGTTGIIVSNSHASQSANGQNHTSLYVNPTFLTTSSNLNNTYGLLISPSSSGQYTTTNSYGLYVNASTLVTGTIVGNYAAVFMGGNVGVGTAAPSARLEVAASGTTSLDIAHFSNSNGVEKAKVSLSSAGDGTLSLIDASNNTDIFLTSNASTASYINAGNVGIGTISPVEKLEIDGSLKFANCSSRILRGDNNNIRLSSGGSAPGHFGILIDNTGTTNGRIFRVASWADGTTGKFVIRDDTAGADRLTIQANGDVGIGTTTPSSQLHVIGSGVFSSGIRVGDSSTNGYIIGPSGNTRIQINSAGTNRIDINSNTYSNSNLYIGTQYTYLNSASTYANGSFQFPAASTDPTSTATQRDSNVINIYNKLWSGSAYVQGKHEISVKASTATNLLSRIAFSTHIGDGTTTMAERLSITSSSGYVGIGTTTPSAQLHVAGDILATGSFIAGSGSAALPSFEFIDDTDTGLFSPAANTIALATSGVERLRINNIGAVVQTNSYFNTLDDRKSTTYLLSTTTTYSVTSSELSSNGNKAIKLDTDRTYTFSILVTARQCSSAGLIGGFKLEGIVTDQDGLSAIIGTPVKTVFAKDDVNWDINASITSVGPDNYLTFTAYCPTSTSHETRWVANLLVVEVGTNGTGY